MAGVKRRGALQKLNAALVSTRNNLGKTPTYTCFKTFYSRKHDPKLTFSLWTMNDSTKLLFNRLRSRMVAAEAEPLWWTITTPVKMSPSSYIRRWCSRRIRSAFVKHLTARGYDSTGLLVEGRKNTPAMLYGTIRMLVDQTTLTASDEQVDKEVSDVVDRIIQQSK